jgi:hypothetical protein
MWYHQNKISPEEKKKALAAYKAAKKEEAAKGKAEDAARAAAAKAETPEDKAAHKAAAAEKAKAAKEKAAQEKADAKAAKAAEKAKIAAMNPDEKKAYLAQKKADHAAYVAKEFAAYKEKHAALVKAKGEALANRYDLGGNIHRFFFNIGQSGFCQGYMSWWRKLSIAHPGLAKTLYQVFYFIVFSEGVTIWQLLVMLFLPYAFGSLCQTAFVWPAVSLGIKDAAGNELVWAIFNEPMKNAAGNLTTNPSEAVVGGGLGNFIAFEIAVFTAQCINFPLQRNITFKSHGNVYWQAMWYFIGWIGISIFVNAVWGIVNPFMLYWGWNDFVKTLLKTFITGGISMIIFFFIFRIIFPAGEVKDEAPVEKK